MTFWDDKEARRELERRRLAEEVGPCPHCGAEAEIDLIDVTSLHDPYPMYVPGEPSAKCSARCWEDDPEGYLAALARRVEEMRAAR